MTNAVSVDRKPHGIQGRQSPPKAERVYWVDWELSPRDLKIGHERQTPSERGEKKEGHAEDMHNRPRKINIDSEGKVNP